MFCFMFQQNLFTKQDLRSVVDILGMKLEKLHYANCNPTFSHLQRLWSKFTLC